MHETPLLQGTALEERIESLVYPHVTLTRIQEKIKEVQYITVPGTTSTLCYITLVNGFHVIGESACVDPRNYDREVGQGLAYKSALQKIWPLEGYLLAEQNHLLRTLQRKTGSSS